MGYRQCADDQLSQVLETVLTVLGSTEDKARFVHRMHNTRPIIEGSRLQCNVLSTGK